MMIDKNGKLFGKINLIDFAVVALIIVAILGIGLRFFVKDSMDRDAVKVTYTTKIENVRIQSVDAFDMSNEILADGKVVGEIVSVKSEPYTTREIDVKGNMTEAEVPERYTVYVEVCADALVKDDGYFMGGTEEISVGASITTKTKYLNTNGKIIDMKVE